MKLVVPPFDLGETYKGTDDDGNLINPQWLGQVHEHPYNNRSGSQVRGNRKRITGRQILAIALRNLSGGTLFGKTLGTLNLTTGGDYGLIESVDGLASAQAQKLLVAIDPQLPAAGVADNDIFWGLISGPAVLLTPSAQGAFNGNITRGNQLVSAADAGGRVANIAAVLDADSAFASAANLIGVALEDVADTEVDTEIKVHLTIQI